MPCIARLRLAGGGADAGISGPGLRSLAWDVARHGQRCLQAVLASGKAKAHRAQAASAAPHKRHLGCHHSVEKHIRLQRQAGHVAHRFTHNRHVDQRLHRDLAIGLWHALAQPRGAAVSCAGW